MPFFVVHYHYTEDVAGRDEHRPEHKRYLSSVADRGLILVSGPFAEDEIPGAAMIYQSPDKQSVVDVIEGDPFWLHGLIRSFDVTRWVPLIGPWAADAQHRSTATIGGRP